MNKTSFISSFTICIPFIFSCCYTAIVRTSSMILKRTGERVVFVQILGLVPEHRVKVSTFLLLGIMLTVGFGWFFCLFVLQMFHIKQRKFLSIPCFMRIFIMNAVRFCQMLFSSFIDTVTIFLLQPVDLVGYINRLQNQPYVPEISSLLVVQNSFYTLLDLIANILLKTFASVFMRYCSEDFL